ncbi:MAG: hypothetical protein U0Z53_16605 [Blastocatellia bacterium]
MKKETIIQRIRKYQIVISVGLLLSVLTVGLLAGDSAKVSLDGNWNLTISLNSESVSGDDPRSSVTLIFSGQGKDLTGKAMVPDLAIDEESKLSVTEYSDVPLLDLKFDGNKLTFVVDDGQGAMTAELKVVTNDLFEGEWRMPTSGRFKSPRAELNGKLKMTRGKK